MYDIRTDAIEMRAAARRCIQFLFNYFIVSSDGDK